MPRRVLDGEALWTSRKLARAQPAWTRGEYAWLHPLAASNGVFEWDTNAIWAKCYAYARPDKTPEDVQTIGDAFEQAKLLFRWQQDGKTWAYWVGSDKRGRLPRRSWVERDRKKGRLGPDPPDEELRRFLASDTLVPCQQHASSVHGSGSGIGLAFGSGNGERAAHAPPPAAGVRASHPTELTPGFEDFWSAYPRKEAKQDAIRAWKKVRADEVPMILAAVEKRKVTEDWQRENGRYVPLPATFLNGRRWEDQIPEPSEARKEKTSGPDFSGTDRAAESFRRRIDDVAGKVGPAVLTPDRPN